MTLGLIALVLGAAALGFAAPLVKLSELGPQATAFWRLTLALPGLLLWRAFAAGGNGGGKGDWRLFALAGLLFAGDLAFWHAGIRITTAANATLLANLTPVVVAVGAWLIFKERLTRAFILAAGVAISGAAILAGANIEIAPERLPGDALSAITALWYGAYILAIRAARKGGSTASVMLWSTACAAPAALVITLAFGEDLLPATAAGWIPLLLLGLGVHVFGQGGLAFGLGRVPAALASVVILIQSVVAAIAGWLMFGETLVPIQFLGAALVLAGVWMARRSGAASTRPLGKTPPSR